MTNGDLRLWWIPQLGHPPVFHVAVSSVDEAIKIYNTLAFYDLFQFENSIKPDYTNAGGLEVWENGEWSEWEDEDGDQIDTLARVSAENSSGNPEQAKDSTETTGVAK